ncbi:type VII secretion protein EccE [Nocardia sp. NPDC005978]|uniref:type VII secretion protein EccE n=1 Tax=Nocardia sp. NPDC005978 TaxID=3156725 RepID=UPI00339EECAD
MSAPVASLAGPEGTPLTVVLLGGSAAVTTLVNHVSWGLTAATVVVLVVVVTVRVRGRTTARWCWSTVEFGVRRGRRAHERRAAVSARDITVPAGTCGVIRSGTVLVSMIQLSPNLDLPTVISERSIYTEATIRADTLSEYCAQYGLKVDIDLVTTGRRIRQVGSYGDLYDQLIGARPVVGQRLAWLIVRLDLHDNLHHLRRRGPVAVAAPRALAVAAHRVAARLRARGIDAHPLPAEEIDHARDLLCEGIDPDRLHERWGRLDCATTGRSVRVYTGHRTHEPLDLDSCWSHGNGFTTVVVSLAHHAAPRVLVRYIDTHGTENPWTPPAGLSLWTGRQSDAFMATLPAAATAHSLGPAHRAGTEHDPGELTIAIGPSGQVLGSISGRHEHSLALPLFDPVRYHPRHRTVDIHADLQIAQQILLRATVVGASVEVHTDRPDQWRPLITALGDERSLRLIVDNQTVAENGTESRAPATIAVFDRVSPRTSQAATTVTITAPDKPRRPSSDLAIEQVGDGAIELSIPSRTVRVDLIEPRGETRYVNARPTTAPPDSTESPVLTPAAPALLPHDRTIDQGDAR